MNMLRDWLLYRIDDMRAQVNWPSLLGEVVLSMAGLMMANGTVAFLAGAAGAIATIAAQMGEEAVQFNSKEEIQRFFDIWYDTLFYQQLQRQILIK